MRRVAFHPEADNEVIEAARYYETRSAGLGFSFLIELDSSIEQVVANPEAYQLVSEDVRRKPFRRFPHSLLYVIEVDRIRVVAVAHQKRRPNYWRFRLLG
ncbi:MAG: plasmid stabilization protein [Deltaproteobacteria bacterium]|nr:MAG: plasmid stabilization protein [Deltaproteobacteria bacterium]